VKKEMNRGVVVGILVVVGVIVAIMGWKAIAPPAAPEIKHFDKAEMQVMMKKHAASVTDMQEEQKKLFQQAHGGQ
jgi:ABC-type molybdate transport system substrate-binding protein